MPQQLTARKLSAIFVISSAGCCSDRGTELARHYCHQQAAALKLAAMRCLAVLATANALQQRYFASTARGCEPYLADELDEYQRVSVEIGAQGVHFDGDTRVGYAALIHARTATKVLEVLAWRNGVETAADPQSWERRASARAHGRRGHAARRRDADGRRRAGAGPLALLVADPEKRRRRFLRGENQLGRRPSVAKDDCDVPLHLFLDRDRCTLYTDLYHRIAAQARLQVANSHRAALRPTVAAAMSTGPLAPAQHEGRSTM